MTEKKKRYGQRRYTKRAARDLVDQDYAETLSEENQDYLDKFNREYYQGDFQHEDPLHATDELRKDCYRKNNERNRDGWNKWVRQPKDLLETTTRTKTDKSG